jgi:hypothetical protein
VLVSSRGVCASRPCVCLCATRMRPLMLECSLSRSPTCMRGCYNSFQVGCLHALGLICTVVARERTIPRVLFFWNGGGWVLMLIFLFDLRAGVRPLQVRRPRQARQGHRVWRKGAQHQDQGAGRRAPRRCVELHQHWRRVSGL